MSQRTDLLTPPGRLVAGSLYKANTTNAEGGPLVNKSGPAAGQARVEYYFAVAIPKEAGHTHWAQTAWGQIIYNVGRTDFPAAHQAPTFAWKVKDGDSTVPNRRGKKPCDMEGAPGHWMLSFSSGYPPKVSRENGTVPIVEADAVNLGDYVQVFGSVAGNGSQQQSGVFLNHSMVNLTGYGKRIVVGPDAASVGFGAALPAGASATPLAGTFNPPPTATPAPFVPPVAAAAPVVPPVAVQPHPGFLAPAAPAAPPAAPARAMTAKAAGATYETFVAVGWNDQTLVQHGYMAA